MVDSEGVAEHTHAPSMGPPGDARSSRDGVLVEALRLGDEAAFAHLVDLHHRSMIRIARLYVASDAAAEEVAQDAWIGVLQGIDRFEGRSTLKAWMFAIVANCAKHRGTLDKRSVPLSALAPEDDDAGPSVDPDRFLDESHARWPGHWADPPTPWAEREVESRETLAAVAAAMEHLAPMQRAVMTMRDVEGVGAEETCQILGLTEGHQRVLLHRARSKVRKLLEHRSRRGEVTP